jgi:transcriptional regulator of arginine metabolism
MIVLKTASGSAHVVALALDQAQLPEIAGTVAGDDTLFLAIRDGHDVAEVLRRFRFPPGGET